MEDKESKKPQEETQQNDNDNEKPEPISLEELRDKMREREKMLSKPTFLTKEQREQIALKRREKEVKQRQEKLLEIQKQREALTSKSQMSRRETRPKEDNEGDKEELDKIKVKYLGAPPVKKKVIKPSEKFKFTFAWEASEDTSLDTNPLYKNPYEAQLLFGRGFRGGIDSREQISKQIDYEHLSKSQSEDSLAKEKEDLKRKEREFVKERKEKEERERRRQKVEEKAKEIIKTLGDEDEDEDEDED